MSMRVRAGVGVILLVGVAGCGGGSKGGTPTTPTVATPADFDFGPNNRLKATAFGDSITQGVLVDTVTRNNYPNNLQARLRGLDPAWRVINRGRGGEPTGEGARRLPGVLRADRSGFVLILEGTNDATAREPAGRIAGNLEGMVNQVRASQSIPIIGTLPPNFRNDPTAQQIIAEVNGMIRAMARANGVVVAEIFDGMNDRSLFSSPDPLHPNERGYVVMAGIWFGALQQTLPMAVPSRMAGIPARPIPALLSPGGPVLALAD